MCVCIEKSTNVVHIQNFLILHRFHFDSDLFIKLLWFYCCHIYNFIDFITPFTNDSASNYKRKTKVNRKRGVHKYTKWMHEKESKFDDDGNQGDISN